MNMIQSAKDQVLALTTAAYQKAQRPPACCRRA